MSIKIMMAIPTLNQYTQRLPETLRGLAASTRQPDRLLIVDNGHQWHKQSYAEGSARCFNLDVFDPHTNLGVAGSVNYAWRNTPDGWWWLHCNDDVDLDPHCIGLLVGASQTVGVNPYNSFIIPEHGEGSAFTVFMIHASLRDRLGLFDEQFFPAYMEDNDLGLRMSQLGVQRVVVPGAAYVHHTSSTLKSYTPEQERLHHDQFRANTQRYIDKWGGPPDQERYEIPYNGSRGHTTANRHLWHKERP